MKKDHNVVEHIVSKQIIQEKIALVIENLTTIQDNGDFFIHFEDVVVDDKSWNVWNWPQGVGLYGLYKYYELTEDEQAYQVVLEWFEKQLQTGAPPKNVNTMAPLLTMAFLYEKTGDQRYLPYLEVWAEWVMKKLPRTREHGFEHLTYGPERFQQLWDDTLMMTVLPLAKIGRLLQRDDYLEEVKRQFMLHIKYLTDRKSGLWYHGWTFEGNHNFSEALWGRGNCWITIAIPEVIDILDLKPGDGFRAFLIDTLERQAAALAEYQHASGLWSTLINEPQSYEESSATAGFAYGILKAVRKGYIDEKYQMNGERAIQALVDQVAASGEVQQVSVGTAIGENLDYYRTIPLTSMAYGQSLVVLAFSEYLYDFI
ncbi:glycoside hydrolase family 88 protein [Enterococcus sp. BWT-B8]|uniref:beta-galactosidase BglB n=1 Tax=Enterococcus sp. BWT-B8 TaxID=2885157 RepID=UPI001E3D4045|nr:glycoside hydrolase family 88 protein [Enterococcus sp. BWT-B8]MCB5953168.1 glycoside hydrolase family 88 protein [Enterococcus sp. BWT-B8]